MRSLYPIRTGRVTDVQSRQQCRRCGGERERKSTSEIQAAKEAEKRVAELRLINPNDIEPYRRFSEEQAYRCFQAPSESGLLPRS